MVILKYKKSGKLLKLWHVNANTIDVMRLIILSWGLLDPNGTSRVKLAFTILATSQAAVRVSYAALNLSAYEGSL